MPRDVENTYEYRQMQAEIQSISSTASEEMRRFDERNDTIERFLNWASDESPFTDRQRWLMGQTSNNDYYTTELYRDYRKMEMREKAREEISRLECQMEHMCRQEAKARYELQRARASAGRDMTLRFLRCGYAVYLREELVGIVIIARPERVYQIHHRGTVSPHDIFGRIGDCREIGRETPDPGPLIPFILQEFGSRMKPYSLLAPVPKTRRMDWRYWAEARFAAQFLNE